MHCQAQFCYNGGMKAWFENPAFWKSLYPVMFPDARFAAADAELDGVLALADRKIKTVLDLCCGPGRHSVALAKRGLRVTGVDRTPFLLNMAKRRAQAARVKVEWVLKDMRAFVRPKAFDLALSLFTSFGYFDDKADDLTVLRNLHASLAPGGVLVLDVASKEWVAKVFQPTVSCELPDGSLLVQRHEIIDDWSRIRNEWILIRKGRVQRFPFQHTIYSGIELKDRLLVAGFDTVTLYGGLDGSPFGINAKRLVAVARKQKNAN